MSFFEQRLATLRTAQEALLARPNPAIEPGNGCLSRHRHPIITPAHTPLDWRYDLNPDSNPWLQERLAINATFNPGAIEFEGRHLLVVRVEGSDRKSFFAIAESHNGIDQFRFWDEPCIIPETEQADTNVYDMRLVRHQDGYIYGLFCTERKDPRAHSGDESAAVAQCGIVRTQDLRHWQRLSDLQSDSAQQRNVVLHPEFVAGRYLLYTRPQDSFIDAGHGGGIGYGFCHRMDDAVITEQHILDPKQYHTIKESKNGQGPAPIKTDHGWLHIAHGVRQTAAGLRYVLYAFMTDLAEPTRVTHRPGGYLLAPEGDERVGDVSNVLFCNGVIAKACGQVLIYYAASDSRCHVASSTIEQLVDWVLNTPEDALTSAACVQQRLALIRRNRSR